MFFNLGCATCLPKAITAILEDNRYRIQVAMANYKAACELSCDEIIEMFLQKFNEIEINKMNKKIND